MISDIRWYLSCMKLIESKNATKLPQFGDIFDNSILNDHKSNSNDKLSRIYS